MAYAGMPEVRQGRLWLAETHPIGVGTPAWFAWLERADRFSYQPAATGYRLPVRKEKRRQRWYWYAYLKVDAKLHNAYVGRSEALSAERLAQVAQQLVQRVWAAQSADGSSRPSNSGAGVKG